MALDLLYNPGTYFSAHGDLIFTLLEDTKPFSSSVYPDYKYVCDVYIAGLLEARLKAFPRSTDKIGVFNIGNVVRNYLITNFAPTPSVIHTNEYASGAFYVEVICRFGEEYGNVTYSNIIVDSQRTYFNHYNGRLFGTETILTNYLDKVLSRRPYATTVKRDASHCFIPFMTTDDTTIELQIRCYNKSLGLIRQSDVNIIPTPGSTDTLQQFNLSPAAINAVVPGTIDSIIDYYTVTFSTTNIVDDSVYRFDIICEPKYDTYALHFMNRFGGFESKEFTKVSRRQINIEKSDYGSSAYAIGSDGIPAYYNDQNVYRETRKNYAGAWKEKMTLNSDLLRDDEYTWLEDLVNAPVVYIEMEGYFFPATITDNNYEAKKTINDDLTNLTLNIEFGDRFNTQYR
jgi:hypothetical protein